MTHKEYADSLRLIADFFEAHEEVALPHDAHEFSLYNIRDRESLVTLMRALGSCKKCYDESFFRVEKRFGSILLKTYMHREAVCERIVKEKFVVKELRAKPVVQVAPTEFEEVEVEKEVIEWRCPDAGILETISQNA